MFDAYVVVVEIGWDKTVRVFNGVVFVRGGCYNLVVFKCTCSWWLTLNIV